MTDPARIEPLGGRFSDLGTRIVSAVVLVVAAVGSLLAGGTVFVLFWLAAAAAIHWEWQRMVGGERRFARFVAGACALCLAAAFCVNLAPDLAAIVILLGVIVVGLMAGPSRRLWAGAGLLYAGVLIISVAMIRPALPVLFQGPFDVRAIVWLFGVVWATDVMAYFGGRAVGGPKIWPAVSPGKTWSGTIIGVICGALAGLAVALVKPILPVTVWPLLAVGLVCGCAAQAGDLLESGIKRRFGVKDSSHLIPGHGGVMDRLDGFVAAAAVVVVLALWRDAASVGEALFRW
jgi:phosphatidate cytidylyltransferase